MISLLPLRCIHYAQVGRKHAADSRRILAQMLDEQDEAKDDEPPLPAPCEPPSSEIQQTEEADGKMMEASAAVAGNKHLEPAESQPPQPPQASLAEPATTASMDAAEQQLAKQQITPSAKHDMPSQYETQPTEAAHDGNMPEAAPAPEAVAGDTHLEPAESQPQLPQASLAESATTTSMDAAEQQLAKQQITPSAKHDMPSQYETQPTEAAHDGNMPEAAPAPAAVAGDTHLEPAESQPQLPQASLAESATTTSMDAAEQQLAKQQITPSAKHDMPSQYETQPTKAAHDGNMPEAAPAPEAVAGDTHLEPAESQPQPPQVCLAGPSTTASMDAAEQEQAKQQITPSVKHDKPSPEETQPTKAAHDGNMPEAAPAPAAVAGDTYLEPAESQRQQPQASLADPSTTTSVEAAEQQLAKQQITPSVKHDKPSHEETPATKAAHDGNMPEAAPATAPVAGSKHLEPAESQPQPPQASSADPSTTASMDAAEQQLAKQQITPSVKHDKPSPEETQPTKAAHDGNMPEAAPAPAPVAGDTYLEPAESQRQQPQASLADPSTTTSVEAAEQQLAKQQITPSAKHDKPSPEEAQPTEAAHDGNMPEAAPAPAAVAEKHFLKQSLPCGIQIFYSTSTMTHGPQPLAGSQPKPPQANLAEPAMEAAEQQAKQQIPPSAKHDTPSHEETPATKAAHDGNMPEAAPVTAPVAGGKHLEPAESQPQPPQASLAEPATTASMDAAEQQLAKQQITPSVKHDKPSLEETQPTKAAHDGNMPEAAPAPAAVAGDTYLEPAESQRQQPQASLADPSTTTSVEAAEQQLAKQQITPSAKHDKPSPEEAQPTEAAHDGNMPEAAPAPAAVAGKTHLEPAESQPHTPRADLAKVTSEDMREGTRQAVQFALSAKHTAAKSAAHTGRRASQKAKLRARREKKPRQGQATMQSFFHKAKQEIESIHSTPQAVKEEIESIQSSPPTVQNVKQEAPKEVSLFPNGCGKISQENKPREKHKSARSMAEEVKQEKPPKRARVERPKQEMCKEHKEAKEAASSESESDENIVKCLVLPEGIFDLLVKNGEGIMMRSYGLSKSPETFHILCSIDKGTHYTYVGKIEVVKTVAIEKKSALAKLGLTAADYQFWMSRLKDGSGVHAWDIGSVTKLRPSSVKFTSGKYRNRHFVCSMQQLLQGGDVDVPKPSLHSTAGYFLKLLGNKAYAQLSANAHALDGCNIRIGTGCSGSDICVLAFKTLIETINQEFGVLWLWFLNKSFG